MTTNAAPELVDLLRRWIGRGGARPLLIGVAGAQGCGKTTLCAEVAAATGSARFSLDDVYLTKTDREALARDIHPLFATRGPPGTHDLALARNTIATLAFAGPTETTSLPAFDKLADDRLPRERWPTFAGRPRAILIDGWCIGATAQASPELSPPVNPLERDRDPDGKWRRAVNRALAGPYADFFRSFDAVLHMAAPSFAVVLDWRCEQEAGLLGVPRLPAARRRALADFVAHYERVTRHMLAGGVRADATARLAPDRTLTRLDA